jgi:hypothetical protein
MHWVANVVTLSAVISIAGCSPDVVIARSDNVAGGGAGGSAAGTGGTDVGGTGGTPVTTGGDGGTDTVVVEAPRLLADSVADFSTSQGDHSWQYGYDNGSLDNFTLMTKKSVITLYVPASNDVWECWVSDTAHWTQVFALGAHPNGTISSQPSVGPLQRAVRRWVSTFAGPVTIYGELAKIDTITGSNGGSNGVDGLIYVDGERVYSKFIGGDDAGGVAYKVIASVNVGSNVDFVLDPHEGDDHHDLSRFTGIIMRADNP